MSLAALALILLSSSYLWLRRWQLSRSHLMRSDGHALYFIVVAAAVPLGLWTGSVIQALAHLVGDPSLPLRLAAATLGSIIPKDKERVEILLFGMIVIASLPFAPILALVLNLPVLRCSALTARLLVRLGSIAELERFLWDVNERGLSVMATTSSGKVYVGNSLELPVHGGERKFIRLEPLLSGYRDDHQEFQATTSYRWITQLPPRVGAVGDALCRRDFDVMLPVESLTSVHSFDLTTYVKRFPSGKAPSAGVIAAATDENEAGIHPLKSERNGSKIALTEWFYLGFVACVLVTPSLAAYDFNFLATLSLVLGVLFGLFSSAESWSRQAPAS